MMHKKGSVMRSRFLNGSLVSLVALFVVTLSSCSPLATPPGPDVAGGSVEQGGFTFMRWEEGLAVMTWHDLESSTHHGSGSTTDLVYRLRGDAQSLDGRRVDWELETVDGKTAQFWIDGTSYDLSNGTLFIIATGSGRTEVRQLQRDLSGVRADYESCVAFAQGDPELAGFVGGPAGVEPTTPPLSGNEGEPGVGDPLSEFEALLVRAVEIRYFELMESLMGDEFSVAGWRSEDWTYSSSEAIEQLRLYYLGADNTILFQDAPDLSQQLGSRDVLSVWDPAASPVSALFSVGWGADGEAEAFLIVAQRPDDDTFYWAGILIALSGFADGTIQPSEPISPPSGLVYQTADGVWQVNADGQVVQLFDRADALISPDGSQILYEEDGDLWLAGVVEGERRNLTQTPDRLECCAQWWPGRQDAILFNSRPIESEGTNYGFPTVIILENGDCRVLDESEASFALPAPSPDGQTVAYDRAGQAWLYRQGTGPEPFDLVPYGLTSDPQLRVVSPAWSPDGQRLAWVVGDCRQGECEYSIGVFDLEAQTVRFLHPYRPVGMGGQPPAPAWSPDGRWLAFITWAEDFYDAGLWVARVDGQQEEEYPLATGGSRPSSSVVWSPDKRWMALNVALQGGGSGPRLVDTDTWSLYPLKLPSDARPVGWNDLRP